MSHSSDDESLKRFLQNHRPIPPAAPAEELTAIQARIQFQGEGMTRSSPGLVPRRQWLAGGMMAGVAAALLGVWLALPVAIEPTADAMAEWELLLPEEESRQEGLAGYGDFPAQDVGEEFLMLVFIHEEEAVREL
jgi:hypothetical protein